MGRGSLRSWCALIRGRTYYVACDQPHGHDGPCTGRQSYNNSTNSNGADEDIEAGIVGNANVVGYVSPRAEAWITGTGNTVNPTGNGTADLYHNGSNLKHLSDAGNLYYGRKLAQALATLIPA